MLTTQLLPLYDKLFKEIELHNQHHKEYTTNELFSKFKESLIDILSFTKEVLCCVGVELDTMKQE